MQFRINYNLGATGVQNFFVSDTLIEELVSLDAFLQEEPNSSVSFNDRIPKSLVELAHKCHKYSAQIEGIAHLLLGYKDVNKETIWLYAYYYQHGGHHVLVFCPCSSDPTRDVMMAASVIKKYLEAINKSKMYGNSNGSKFQHPVAIVVSLFSKSFYTMLK